MSGRVKPLTVKSSLVLQHALEKLKDGRQCFACAAIMDTELDFSYDNGNRIIKSQALSYMLTHKPSIINDNMKMTQPWWPKDDPLRLEAVEKAIAAAQKRGD